MITDWHCSFRSGITSRSDASSPFWVIWITSAQQFSTTSTRGCSVLLMTRQSASGTGNREPAFAFSPGTTITWCARSSTLLKTPSFPLAWIKPFASGTSQVCTVFDYSRFDTRFRGSRVRWDCPVFSKPPLYQFKALRPAMAWKVGTKLGVKP